MTSSLAGALGLGATSAFTSGLGSGLGSAFGVGFVSRFVSALGFASALGSAFGVAVGLVSCFFASCLIVPLMLRLGRFSSGLQAL